MSPYFKAFSHKKNRIRSCVISYPCFYGDQVILTYVYSSSSLRPLTVARSSASNSRNTHRIKIQSSFIISSIIDHINRSVITAVFQVQVRAKFIFMNGVIENMIYSYYSWNRSDRIHNKVQSWFFQNSGLILFLGFRTIMRNSIEITSNPFILHANILNDI